MDSLRSLAAANNAEWCDIVGQTHGVNAMFEGDAWTSRTRMPPLYPDAVTLVADVAAAELLARIDASPGCSIKDSFASLDLTPLGFRVLFDAEWIVRPPAGAEPIPTSPRWTIVRDVDAFAAWEVAWRGRERPQGVLLVDLLDYDSVVVLSAVVDSRVVSGAVLHRGSGVVGISNFFADDDLAAESWRGCIAFASSLSPGSALVGYGTGPVAARAHGFEVVGPLRVWIRED